MKKLLILSVFTILTLESIAQSPDTTKFPFNKMKLNFAIPDMPAFKAMGTEASNLLRPSTPQAFAIIAPQFWTSDLNRTVLPKNIAFEISPILLSQQNKKVPITLNQFLKNKVANSFRISVGTARDSTEKQPKATKLGVGFRISLIDNGNLNYDTKYLENEGLIMADSAKLIQELKTKWIQIKIKQTGRGAGEIVRDTTLKNEFEKYRDSTIIVMRKLRSNEKFYTEKLIALKDDYKNKNWNAGKLDIAVAFVGRSSDQFTSNLKFDKISSWVTGSIRCKDWGQWLHGINYSYADNVFSDKEKKTISFSQFSYTTRLFVGSNNLKGFIEGQYLYNGFDESNNGFLNIGGEFALGQSGIWIHCYAGYQHGENLKQVIGNLDFRFSLPEK
jgi:hypothetical protein